MSLVVKFFIIILFATFQTKLFARDLYILIIGQSISANCNKYIYSPSNNVFQINLSGERIPASDPFIWSDCHGGSMWIPLGQKIITEKYASSVTFMPIGVSGSSVNDWLPGGKAFQKLSNAIQVTKQKSIQFDYAFWHQGSTDNGTPPEQYAVKLNRVLKYISTNTIVDKWLISQHSRCGDLVDNKITNAQKQVASAHILRRFHGPNTDALGNEFRYDKCHLNRIGQEHIADLWFQSMVVADTINSAVQKETLIQNFKGRFN